ncbi:MAG: CBS domain-containing protein [Nitrososphaerota archaeon]|nr:CBS domain-containing protein [Nitrososphaerota archaeon]
MPEKTSDIWWLFSRQTVSVTTKETVLNAAVLMKNRNFRHLPVLSESGKILGILSVQDIIDSLNLTLQASTSADEVRKSLEIPVERIMTGQPIAVEPGDGLKEVIKKFSFYNVGAIPVVSITGVVEGIITLRDLVSLMGTSSSPLNVPVSEIMSSNVTTVDPGAPLAEAVRLMSEHRVRRLPVVGPGDSLIGVLTNKDVLRYTVRMVGDGSSRSSFDRRVSESMTADVITIDREDDVRVAANLMATFGVGGLAVSGLAAERMALVTERDLIRSLSAKRGVDFLVSSMQYELEAEDAMARVRSHAAR